MQGTNLISFQSIKKYETNIPAVTNENTLHQVVKAYLEKEIFSDETALSAYIEYVACFMNIPEGHESFDSLGEKIDTEKGVDFQTLKSKALSIPFKIFKSKFEFLTFKTFNHNCTYTQL